jgi:cell wall-associated NlpC family hydrolase
MYQFDGLTTPGFIKKDKLVENALMYLNAPYLWGGRSPLGIDCSGFTQMVYRLQGVDLPRDAYQQAEVGTTLSFVEESEPGDLAFFDNTEGKITHVGIILEDNHIIHASGKVRIDRIDQQGVFNTEIGNHTHKLRLIKSIC